MKHTHPFYLSEAWKNLRKAFLQNNPICAVPGCGKAARHVDHIVSRRRGGAALDPRNLKQYCWSHHSQKTNAVDGGFGNPIRMGEHRFTVRGCDASGNPIDPHHRWHTQPSVTAGDQHDDAVNVRLNGRGDDS